MDVFDEFDIVRTCRPMFVDGNRGVPGKNIDRIDIDAGLRELGLCGYNMKRDERTFYVIQYALARWKRGEEAAAEKGAIDGSFYGVTLTVWRRVLAAARAAGEANARSDNHV